MHSELSYGLSFAPKLQRVRSIHLSGSHQPTPDPSFSLIYTNHTSEAISTGAGFEISCNINKEGEVQVVNNPVLEGHLA